MDSGVASKLCKRALGRASREEAILNPACNTLLRACNGILTHIKERYPDLGLHVEFPKKGETLQLHGLVTKKKLRVVTERRNYYASDTVFSCFAVFIDGSLRFVKMSSLTWMNIFYNGMPNKALFDQRGDAWVELEIMRLRSKIP